MLKQTSVQTYTHTPYYVITETTTSHTSSTDLSTEETDKDVNQVPTKTPENEAGNIVQCNL